jgi:histidinol phosphatase-like PHP family hydrolase
VAHLTCSLLSPAKNADSTMKTLSLIKDKDMKRLFAKAAKLGVGIELNVSDWEVAEENISETMRPFRIAAECGCKFYLGSDAHAESGLNCAVSKFEKMIDLLGLTEDQKFKI